MADNGNKLNILAENIKCIFDKNYKNSFEYLYKKGIVTYGKKDYKNACNFFQSAYKINSKDFNCIYNLALSNQALLNFEEAMILYETALALKNDDYDTLYNLGLCYLNLHMAENALSTFEFLKQINPEDLTAKMNYILALVEVGKIDESINETISFVKINNANFDFTLTLAKYIELKTVVTESSETIDKIIKLLRSYIKIEKKSSQAFLQISTCYGRKAMWNEALEYSMKALEFEPKSFEINAQIGLILFCSQDYVKALEYYKKALKLDKNKSLDCRIDIAFTLEKLNKKQEALNTFKQIFKDFKTFDRKNDLMKHVKDLENRK